MCRTSELLEKRRRQRGIGAVGLVLVALVLAGIGLGVFHFRTSYALHERREQASKDLDNLTNVRGVRKWTQASLQQRALEILGGRGVTPASPGDVKVELKPLTAAAARQLPGLLRTKVNLGCKLRTQEQGREARFRAAAGEGEAPRGAQPDPGCDDEQIEQLSYTVVRVQVKVTLRKAWLSVPFSYDRQFLIEQRFEDPRPKESDPEE